MNTEQERAAFEAEIRENWGFAKLERVGGDYIDPETQGLWLLWNARAALQSRGPAEQALAELVDKIVPGLDTGDLLADAQRASAALQSQDRKDAPFLQEEDQHALYRFIETAEDGEGYDIGKNRIKRLAELGAVSNHGFGRYSVTAFGFWCHENYWHQNPPLPLKTIDERNAQAAIDHARRIEGEGE